MTLSTVKCTVAGKVQGVCYRASTCEQAAALGLRGWVRNLPDGRVELVMQGEAQAVESLAAWLWQGPPAAHVVSVALEQHDEKVGAGFEVRS